MASSPPSLCLRDLLGVTADQTSPASNTFQVTTGCGGFSQYKAIAFIADITGGTGGALDVIVEHSADGGTTWYEYVHFTQVLAATTKSYVYDPALNDIMTNVGKNNAAGSTLGTAMTLAAGNSSGGQWFDML